MKDKYLLWKIYFFIFIAIGLLGYISILSSFGLIDAVDLIVSIPSLFGLYGLAFQKKMLSKGFWKFYFVFFILWHIGINWYVENLSPDKLSMSIILLQNLVFIPLFIGLYIYAFKGK